MILNTKVITNLTIAGSESAIYSMWLNGGEIAKNCMPGQFINVFLNKGEHILPRPISICETDGCNLRIIYHVAGKGTQYLTEYKSGDKIKISGAFGNGFSPRKDKSIALMGGGIGLPPLLLLAKHIKENFPQSYVAAFAGFRRKDQIILVNEFESLGIPLNIATDDGSWGVKGNVLQCLQSSGCLPDMIYACGPNMMLESIHQYAEEKEIKTKLSFEERMACGFGACVGCAIKIKAENQQGWLYKKVCKDGPIFHGEDVVFNG